MLIIKFHSFSMSSKMRSKTEERRNETENGGRGERKMGGKQKKKEKQRWLFKIIMAASNKSFVYK